MGGIGIGSGNRNVNGPTDVIRLTFDGEGRYFLKKLFSNENYIPITRLIGRTPDRAMKFN